MPTMLDVDDGLHLLLTERDLGLLQLSTVLYYLHESNPDNGLVRDKTDPKAPVSIAAVGMALATIPGVVERGVLFRDFAARGPLPRFRGQDHAEAPAVPARMSAGPEPDASGYKGFFCHFLDIETGRRVWQCELSTIDSAFLFAGAARRRSPGPVVGPVRRRNGREMPDHSRIEHRVPRGELACTPLRTCFSASFPSWTSWVRVPSPALRRWLSYNALRAVPA
ncbi:MAG TPA: hypothetical protein VIK41_07500 [Gemmatimonadaceae bacterium]